ncbi:hypothetical protein AAMO2058_000270100, partial [Amorphochlora amoebiformis]
GRLRRSGTSRRPRGRSLGQRCCGCGRGAMASTGLHRAPGPERRVQHSAAGWRRLQHMPTRRPSSSRRPGMRPSGAGQGAGTAGGGATAEQQ